MKSIQEITFEDVISAPSGTVFADWFEDGIRVVIIRGPAALCCYLGIPNDHPLAGHSYDDVSVRAHGGLTYSGDGVMGCPKGFYWYGWDYAHAGDVSIYSDGLSRFSEGDVEWTPEMVKHDAWQTLYDFKHQMKLAEIIASRSKVCSH